MLYPNVTEQLGWDNLPAADQHRIRAAEGWLDLGSVQDATDELHDIDVTSPIAGLIYVRLWCQSFFKLREWSNLLNASSALISMAPGCDAGYRHRSAALFNAGNVEEAIKLLWEASKILPASKGVFSDLEHYVRHIDKISITDPIVLEAIRNIETKLLQLPVP